MFEWLKNKFGKKDEEVNKENLPKEENKEIEENKKENIIEEDFDIIHDNEIKEDNIEIGIPSEDDSIIKENNNDIKINDEIIINSEDLANESKVETEIITNKEILEDKTFQEPEIKEKEEPKENENIKVETKEFAKSDENINNIEEIQEVQETEEIQEEIQEVQETEEIQEEVQEKKKPSLFQRLKEGLDKTRKEVGIKINTVLGSYVKIDDEMLEDLEDILISADIGMQTTMQLIDNLRETIIRNKINDPKEVKPLLMEEAKKLMNPELNTKIKSEPPTIILVVGVNGVGKTTTIGKLSARFKNENKSVLVCAADTFRAAAIDQLKEWGNRANVDIISHEEGSDPASVVFDAIAAAKARSTDVLIVDTAGRLHNKANLMKELEKINKIIDKNYPEANRENLLVLDATTGQNAMNQAKTFKEATDLTGIALTKLDGTAKGGVVIALQSELEIPIKLVGVGEGINDLQDFDIDNFIEAIFN
ncbi:signal recognition particle-docking protein FtsY [Peptoniphilus sp. MSJ-1]|uniref:Signal recognition particle receptor FtsY n=1 Tax=Peptoniphilus ovalis TaxID=2841503 RepID=A0ABS6FIE6_9FIRM|nr:signal recognition particle-docking protein FtsY [Peptoniphilus ovalis]MBU5669001.1 signal recognition particle-docking protein FtsY [Peptoniphilus ovalis]